MPTCFATASLGYEDLLGQELTGLGADDVQPGRAGVSFSGDLPVMYRACLWSRLASRILLQLQDVPAADAHTLYDSVRGIDWAEHISKEASIAVDFLGRNRALANTQYGAQKVKDAIVDQLRDSRGQRPQVDTDNPDVRINVYLHGENATISIDLSGASLHRRGYRTEQGVAPLKESLAAAILLRADWPGIVAAGGSLCDPLCGSGTLLIEGAMMAADIAPGLLRERFGFHGWLQHDAAAWEELVKEAKARRDKGIKTLPAISGSDHDENMIRVARANAGRAGLDRRIEFSVRELDDCRPAESATGLVVTNPPYGERLGETASLPMLYRGLGLMLKRCYPGWRAAVFTGEPDFAPFLGMRAHKTHTLYNGTLKCRLLHCEISEHSTGVTTVAADFANRLRKNLKHFQRWAKREGVNCYRIYDADLPEYNIAVDLYHDNHAVSTYRNTSHQRTLISKRRRQDSTRHWVLSPS
ncbi:MAG: bifunctional 23S rRNA (guanine(2069)-N(7))-methyltransferase RlmK/23S rRNA (guanine(2445)-N(2))-methyltransferase RlmL [Gammaproteobacteria bacterium]|nr:bifunctional 23S rRNA (guanine(2069)-N(7))-methyltransferase RlmK/23S rRNA (guanine(2445)-N(2))-methyltransferase RlmL [Gammaproteobacteria bacterium]